MPSTSVCLNNKIAGRLEITPSSSLTAALSKEKDYVFTYDPAYLADPEAIPLSLSLPLKADPYDSKSIFPVLANLWPEGIWLNTANERYVSEVGTIYLGDPFPSSSKVFRSLPVSEILFSPETPKARETAQATFIEDEFYTSPVPLMDTHILKRNPKQTMPHRDLISNEIFVTLIAFNYGIPVPTLSRFYLDELYTLIMDRPDRQAPPSAAHFPLFHHCETIGTAASGLEDIFQLGPFKKSNKKTALTCDHIFSLLRHHSLRPALDFRTMIRAITVLLTTGCDDYDLASTLLSLKTKGCRLLQFRDLISQVDMKEDHNQGEHSHRLLQNLFCVDRFDMICDQHIITLAKKMGVNTKYLKNQFIEGSQILTKIAAEILEDYPSLQNETTLQIQQSLNERASFLQEKL